MSNSISSSLALKLGIAFSLLFSGLIWLADILWMQEPLLLPKPDGIAFWYKWQLQNPDFISRSSAWVLYFGHQIIIWWLIFKAQASKPKYISGLHWFNIAALLANAFFVTLHLVQTHIFYDGLAQDVTEQSAQWSVIVLLVVVPNGDDTRSFIGIFIYVLNSFARQPIFYSGSFESKMDDFC